MCIDFFFGKAEKISMHRLGSCALISWSWGPSALIFFSGPQKKINALGPQDQEINAQDPNLCIDIFSAFPKKNQCT